MGMNVPTQDELLDRARALVPVLADRAQACEDLRRVPDETVEDFRAAGFYDICKPSAYGGYQLSPEVLFRVSIELARGCPSSAWAVCLIGIHNWEPGLMDAAASEALWGDDRDARFSSSYAPFGKLRPVEGGYRLSGRWEWSSGSDHCSWVMLGAMLPPQDGPPQQIALLVPRRDYEIVDTWHVAGLKGTGSNDIVVDDAFVPEHLTHHINAPSLNPFDDDIYLMPFSNVFGQCLCAVTQGIAEGALSSYRNYLAERTHKYDGAAMSGDPFQQRTLSEVTAAVQANRLRYHNIFRTLEGAVAEAKAAGQPGVPAAVQIAQMWETQVIAHSNADLVTRLMRASGGGAQRLGHPMQRYFRDINSAVAHAYLNVDRGSLQFAEVSLR